MSGSTRYESEFVVKSELGLHARPAGRFVVLADSFESEISVECGGEWIDGRSVLSLLSLAAGSGTRLKIRAVGPDAVKAVEALGELLEARGPALSDDVGATRAGEGTLSRD